MVFLHPCASNAPSAPSAQPPEGQAFGLGLADMGAHLSPEAGCLDVP